MMAAPKKFHFIGICGTAMGSMAAALRERGFVVTGSDESVYPPMSTFLESKGIALRSGYRPENIPEDADVIVIGNAMKRGNPEVEAVLNRKLYYWSLPELLKELFLRSRHNLVVTGTHGKTTTTSLLAWILTVAKLDPSYVIVGLRSLFGGIRHDPQNPLTLSGVGLVILGYFAAFGGAAEIHTRLRNDGPTPAEVGFVWSDLVAEPEGRIHAGRLRLLPDRVRVPPGACVDLTIGLDVPDDARPGLYHALLQATEPVGLRALLTFPVGPERWGRALTEV